MRDADLDDGDWYIVPDNVDLDSAFPEVRDRSRVIHWADFNKRVWPKRYEGQTHHVMPGVWEDGKWLRPLTEEENRLMSYQHTPDCPGVHVPHDWTGDVAKCPAPAETERMRMRTVILRHHAFNGPSSPLYDCLCGATMLTITEYADHLAAALTAVVSTQPPAEEDPDCAYCGHSASQHRGSDGIRRASCDGGSLCRCRRFQAPLTSADYKNITERLPSPTVKYSACSNCGQAAPQTAEGALAPSGHTARSDGTIVCPHTNWVRA